MDHFKTRCCRMLIAAAFIATSHIATSQCVCDANNTLQLNSSVNTLVSDLWGDEYAVDYNSGEGQWDVVCARPTSPYPVGGVYAGSWNFPSSGVTTTRLSESHQELFTNFAIREGKWVATGQLGLWNAYGSLPSGYDVLRERFYCQDVNMRWGITESAVHGHVVLFSDWPYAQDVRDLVANIGVGNGCSHTSLLSADSFHNAQIVETNGKVFITYETTISGPAQALWYVVFDDDYSTLLDGPTMLTDHVQSNTGLERFHSLSGLGADVKASYVEDGNLLIRNLNPLASPISICENHSVGRNSICVTDSATYVGWEANSDVYAAKVGGIHYLVQEDASRPTVEADTSGNTYVFYAESVNNVRTLRARLLNVPTSYVENRHDTFSTHNVSAPEWDKNISTPATVELDHSSTAGMYWIRVKADSTSHRNGYWYANRANWLPYSSVGSTNYVRAKFYIYRQHQATMSDIKQVPNMKLGIANRFAVTSNLQLQFNDSTDTSQYGELSPSTDPSQPSIYRVDFDPIDAPYLNTFVGGLGSEGLLRRFEVFTQDPEDNGELCMTESTIGTYPTSALTGSAVKVYAPTVSDAGNLKIYNTATDLTNVNYRLTDPVGKETTNVMSYQESSAGITVSSAGVATDVVGALERTFFAGNSDGSSGHANRVRVTDNKQYKVRFHVTSTQYTSNQGWLFMKTRAVKFAYNQTLEIAGGQHQNFAISRQVLPGLGCLNPDKINSENGGWYTILMNTPMDLDIRPDTGSACRMPNITSQPGPGVDALSTRDIKVGFGVWDTLSDDSPSGVQPVRQKSLEAAQFTVDRIEVFVHDRVQD